MSLSLYQIILVSILFAAFAIQVFYYLFFYARILYYKKRIQKSKIQYSTDKPAISVIVCAKNEADNLRKFLPDLLTQDYPNYEVIVVNNGSSDESDDVLSYFSKEYKHLYHTYLPSEARFISTKKMALTVGIKAAKNDILLLTDADCQPQGKDWISNIVRNFDDKTEIVLSYGAYFKQKGFVGKLISFDTFFIALQYMGFALAGKPYMGVGRNLAYRKNLFFKNKGFASHLSLQSGDDDLFVSEVANKSNTKVEVATESITYSVPKTSFKSWYIQKHRHLTTSPYYKSMTKFLIGTESLTRFLFYVSLIWTFAFGDMWLSIFAASVFILRFVTQMLVINLTAKQMNERSFYFCIILYDIFLPLVSLNIMFFSKKKRHSAIKWE